MADHPRDETLDSRLDDDGLVKSSAPYARGALSTAPEIAAGTLIGGRYEVIRRLGEGGMGAVYEAEHTAIQRRVDHGRPWLVMELLVGESLADRVERAGAGDPAWVVRVLDPICRALSQAHQRGFLPRDVKPDNVFLVREDDGAEVPRLLDFGIAKNLLEDRKLTATGAMVGTPAYMAPEQITDPRAVTHACDQYAVGAMAYAVMRALRLDPAERYADLESFRLALHASLALGQTAEQPPPRSPRSSSLPRSSSRPRRRRSSPRLQRARASGSPSRCSSSRPWRCCSA